MPPSSVHFATWIKIPEMSNVTPYGLLMKTTRLSVHIKRPVSNRRKRGWWKRVWFFHCPIGKLPQSILWTPLCLCPCVKRSRLPRLARSLAKYWRLPVETQPVKTVWEEKALDESWAKNTTGRRGGIQTHPDLTIGPVEDRMDRTSKGRGESRPLNPREKERQNNKGLGAVRNEWWNITYLHECVLMLLLYHFDHFTAVLWSEKTDRCHNVLSLYSKQCGKIILPYLFD